jgi:putative SOS response-associated peptidase YedK
MCSQYTIKISKHDLITSLKITDDDYLEIMKTQPEKVVPYTRAPVLHLIKGRRILDTMQFSLIPKWSTEPRSKFATHNARLDTVNEKPTYRDAFKKRHAIVPMTGFIEPIYTGKLAGNMIEFHPPKAELLHAAAIWDEWVDKKTGEILKSFSVITHDPINFVEKNGHDRSPVFLKESDAEEWLKNEGEDSKELKDFLSKKQLEPELETSVDRPMKAGWEKRIK